MVKYKSEVKKAVIVLVLIIFCGSIAMIYSAPQQNYICQQNPNDPRCTSNNNNSGGGGGGSGGSGACNDSDVQKFLKGEDPFPNPPGGSCPAKIRTYKARIGKCETAKKCLSGQVNALKKEIEELEKKIAELEKDPKIKELQDLAKRENELKTCIANCQDPTKVCNEYLANHVADVISCNDPCKEVCKNAEIFGGPGVEGECAMCRRKGFPGHGDTPPIPSDPACLNICKVCPGRFVWCPKTCKVDMDCYLSDPNLFIANQRSIRGICKCENGFCKSTCRHIRDGYLPGGIR